MLRRSLRTYPRALRLAAAGLIAVGAATLVSPLAPSSAPASAAVDNTPWTVPAPPERCSQSRVDSGNVAGCIVVSYNDPASTGWGAPPAPGVGEGWNWQGYTYNGSAALADWEASWVVSNTAPVAGLRAGYLETHRYAQGLFEGFLNEISLNGYDVRGVGGYNFRCTSGNGGWSCPSGDPDDLSNHAWGLAIDMNAGTNPIRSYSSQNGQTACLTPIQTDMPKWVIETAERWGLYWGGYGWNSGCPSTTTERTSVYRDPPHFEFRGTPAQAAAIYEYNIENGAPEPPSGPPQTPTDGICFDGYTDGGEASEFCTPSGMPGARSRLVVDVDAPPEAAAAVINLTAVRPTTAGHFATEGCGPTDTERATSTVNFAPGETSAAMAIVPLDDGQFCVWQSTSAHVVVDVVGFLTESGERLWFEPSTPTRLTDTRTDGVCDGDVCTPGRVPAAGTHTVPTDDQAPRIVNLTVADQVGSGHAAAGQCTTVTSNEFSNINYVARTNRANLALLDNGAAGSCVWVFEDTHVVIDELGKLLPDRGLGWSIGDAERVLDTRECDDTWCAGRPNGGTAYPVDLGLTGPTAVTLTITGATGPGHAWAGGCDELVDGQPDTSSVNYLPGKATANLTIVSPDHGEVCIWVHASAHVVIDARAELVADQTLGLRPTTPTRVLDTRDP